jgi:hypothetical protein
MHEAIDIMHTRITSNIIPRDQKFEMLHFTQNNTATINTNNTHSYNAPTTMKDRVREHDIYIYMPFSLFHSTHETPYI